MACTVLEFPLEEIGSVLAQPVLIQVLRREGHSGISYSCSLSFRTEKIAVSSMLLEAFFLSACFVLCVEHTCTPHVARLLVRGAP